MFPGYVFVRETLGKTRYVDLMKVRGVVRVLEDGWSRLTPVPDAEIEALQQIVSAEVVVYPCAHLRRGERVRVLEGPLAGVEGLFVHDKPSKGRLVVSVNMLGRSIGVEMDERRRRFFICCGQRDPRLDTVQQTALLAHRLEAL